MSSPPSSLIAVVIGENNVAPNSGPYLSNPVEIMIYNVDRTLVVVVDSSGSNTSTDPSNLRIIAAQETLQRLKSIAESQSNGTVPDLAGAIDFDSSATILSQLDDPDTVIPKLSSIDSSGGTDIAAGINSAIQILQNLNTAGLTGILKNKASITVFTDGENNAGPIPVIQAIVNATLNGIRIHFGFLHPITIRSIPSDAPPGYVVPKFTSGQSKDLPATIEEAVLASGGVYAVIGDAESQVAFVRQIENKGFTNSDNSDPGGQSVVGQTQTSDILIDSLSIRSFQFSGAFNENVRVVVDTHGNFHPFLKIIDRNGKIIAVDNDADTNGSIDLDLILPYTGSYNAQVTSQDGRVGLFSIFVDVQNAPILPVVELTPANLNFNNQVTGTTSAIKTVTLANTGGITLAITRIAANGDYSQTNICGASVAAGGNCTISVRFTPTVVGTRNGTVTITTNAVTSPDSVALTGNGVINPIVVTVTSVPTLSELAMLITTLALMAIGFTALARKKINPIN